MSVEFPFLPGESARLGYAVAEHGPAHPAYSLGEMEMPPEWLMTALRALAGGASPDDRVPPKTWLVAFEPRNAQEAEGAQEEGDDAEEEKREAAHDDSPPHVFRGMAQVLCGIRHVWKRRAYKDAQGKRRFELRLVWLKRDGGVLERVDVERLVWAAYAKALLADCDERGEMPAAAAVRIPREWAAYHADRLAQEAAEQEAAAKDLLSLTIWSMPQTVMFAHYGDPLRAACEAREYFDNAPSLVDAAQIMALGRKQNPWAAVMAAIKAGDLIVWGARPGELRAEIPREQWGDALQIVECQKPGSWRSHETEFIATTTPSDPRRGLHWADVGIASEGVLLRFSTAPASNISEEAQSGSDAQPVSETPALADPAPADVEPMSAPSPEPPDPITGGYEGKAKLIRARQLCWEIYGEIPPPVGVQRVEAIAKIQDAAKNNPPSATSIRRGVYGKKH